MSIRIALVFGLLAPMVLTGCGNKNLPPQTRQVNDLRDAFAFAISDGDMAEVKSLLESEPLLLNAPIPSQNNYTPLHCAARVGDASIVRYLLENGADPYIQDDEGQYPQDVATAMDAGEEVVDLLRIR